MRKGKDVTKGSIKKHMILLAIPSMGGMLAITIFNLTDTYFVSQLGTEPLAAMGFTFPVVMIIGAFSSGISIGAGSLVARATGQGDHHRMSEIATSGILLSLISVLIVSGVGLLTMKPLFRALGADEATLPLVIRYMSIWYAGVAVVVMPPISDSYMRSLGDMVRPSIVMLVCAGFNVLLDPILIFGWRNIPAMGISGAAIATLISRFLGMITSLGFVHFKYRLLDFKGLSWRILKRVWMEILSIGLPGVLVRLLPQVIRTMITRMAASIGVVAVAAIAAGSRIESFATVGSMAVGVSLVPLIGQNWGANKLDRVEETRKNTNMIALVYGVTLFIAVLLFSKDLARIFSEVPEVILLIQRYLYIMMIGTIGLNLYNWTSEMLNAAGKPKWSLKINLMGTLLVIAPSIYLGSLLCNYEGMLIGLVFGQLMVGIYAVIVGRNQLH